MPPRLAETPMLTIVRSNTIEALSEALAEQLLADVREGRVADPLAPQDVLVSNNAMSRWLALRLSEALDPAGGGICANVAFHFGGRYLAERIVRLADGPPGGGDDWQPEQLRWQIAAAIVALAETAAAAALGPDELGLWAPLLRLWGEEDAAALISRSRLQLLMELADSFDQYALHRTAMVQRWLKGTDQDGCAEPLAPQDRWQAALYRRLQQVIDAATPTERLEQVRQRLRQDQWLREEGQRNGPLRVFCLSGLPSPYLDLLAAMAETGVRALEFYVLTPSQQPWSDIQERHALLAQPDALRDYDGLLRANGHRLLASLGQSMATSLRRLDQLGASLLQAGVTVLSKDRFIPGDGNQSLAQRSAGSVAGAKRTPVAAAPAGQTLLGRLKDDLRLLRNRDPLSLDPDLLPQPVDHQDHSIAVLSCAGDLRQVESLRQWLLRLLDEQPDLQPRDLLVMTPDVPTFAPLLRAVFEQPAGQGPSLPVRTTDRSLRLLDPLVDLAFRLLELSSDRLERTTVLELLQHSLLCRRFGLREQDHQSMDQLLDAMGVHWGLDGAHRQALGAPADEAHTWRWGMARLALALALDDPHGAVLQVDRLPAAGSWQGVAAACSRGELGPFAVRLLELLDGVLEAIAALAHPRTCCQWDSTLMGRLRRLVAEQDLAGDSLMALNEALEPLRQRASRSCGLDLDAAAVRRLMQDGIRDRQGGYGHHSGAITLSALEPMRSIPHRVVALLGMDEQRLPRREPRSGFDLIARSPQPGDRDRRQEDKALLLEALLASRGWLVATYNGSDPRTGDALNPAAPLADLITALERGFHRADTPDQPLTRSLVFDMPLLPGDPGQLNDAALPGSYDTDHLEAARALQGSDPVPPLWPAGFVLPAVPGDGAAGAAAVEQGTAARPLLLLEELQRFFDDPFRALLQAMGAAPLQRPRDGGSQDDDELDGLALWKLERQLLPLQRLQPAEALTARWTLPLQQRGLLPPGAVAEVLLERPLARLTQLTSREQALLAQRQPCSHELNHRGIRFNLQGNLNGLVLAAEDSFRLQLDSARLKPKRLLRSWIEHLLLNAAGEGEMAMPSLLLCRGTSDNKPRLCRLPRLPQQAAADGLETLLERRSLGLRHPLACDSTMAWEALRRQARDEDGGGRGSLSALLGNIGPADISDTISPSWALLHPDRTDQAERWISSEPVRLLATDLFGPLRDLLASGEASLT